MSARVFVALQGHDSYSTVLVPVYVNLLKKPPRTNPAVKELLEHYEKKFSCIEEILLLATHYSGGNAFRCVKLLRIVFS